MRNSCHHDEQELMLWLDPEPCGKARREEVEYIRRHKMYTRVSREACLRETGAHQDRMGGD